MYIYSFFSFFSHITNNSGYYKVLSAIIYESESHSVVSTSLQPHGLSVQFSSVDSHVWLFVTPWTALLSISNSPSLLKLMSIESLIPSNHLNLCCHLLPPSVFPTIRVFSNESVLHNRCLKHWRFNFSINPSNEYSGPISFRVDWLYLLAVQGTLKSLLQHHSSKASILQHSAFFIVQLSHPYMTTGKTIALTSRTFVGRVMSLLFNVLSRLVIMNSPGKNTGVGSCSRLQGIFPKQGLNPGFPHCRWILYQLSNHGSPSILEWVAYHFSSGSFWLRNWTRVSCIASKYLPAEQPGKPFKYI